MEKAIKQLAGGSLVPATLKRAEDEDDEDEENSPMTLNRYQEPGIGDRSRAFRSL
jgi:hypothetical protein